MDQSMDVTGMRKWVGGTEDLKDGSGFMGYGNGLEWTV